MIRDFLIGSANVKMILDQDKRKLEPLANRYDQLLYHHSAIYDHGLQRFLNQNPMYWCFVPQLATDAKMDNELYAESKKREKEKQRQTTFSTFADTEIDSVEETSTKPKFFAPLIVDMNRTKEEVYRLIRNIPEPPLRYAFSDRQIHEQYQLFFERKENQVRSSGYVDLYHYTVVAVLPEACSRHLRQFIESLFVTHTESNLNLIGRLTHRYPYALFDAAVRGNWCSNLIRPTFQ